MFLYLITNLINNKKYIGITNNITKRWSNHRCANSPDTAIGKAILKYGKENFDFKVLLSNIPIDEIDQYEIDYIKKYETHVSLGKGYNVSKGGRYFQGIERDNIGANNNNAHLTEKEVRYIKSHRNIPLYVLYDDFSEKIGYQAFKDIYQDKTYKNIKPTVEEYPYNTEFSGQFATKGKLSLEEVVELRKKYKDGISWKEAYSKKYQEIYPNEMSFWAVYNGCRYKLVMPEVFTEENKKKHTKMRACGGEKNGRSKLTQEQVNQMRFDFENNIKTRKEIQEEYPFISSASINSVLAYRTWK